MDGAPAAVARGVRSMLSIRSSPLDTSTLSSASPVSVIAPHCAVSLHPPQSNSTPSCLVSLHMMCRDAAFSLGDGFLTPGRTKAPNLAQASPNPRVHPRTVSRTSPSLLSLSVAYTSRSDLVPQSFLRRWMRRSLKRPERAVSFGLPSLLSRTARSSGVPPTFRPLVSRAQLRLTA